jgi:hypothetical protein
MGFGHFDAPHVEIGVEFFCGSGHHLEMAALNTTMMRGNAQKLRENADHYPPSIKLNLETGKLVISLEIEINLPSLPLSNDWKNFKNRNVFQWGGMGCGNFDMQGAACSICGTNQLKKIEGNFQKVLPAGGL